MLAALTQSGSATFKNTVQGALIHLFFNIIGIMIFFPIPMFRIPIPLAKKLGKLTAKYRWFAVVYIIGMFFLLPGIFVGLTFIDSKGIAMYTFLAISAVSILFIVIINYWQSHETLHKSLPKKLKNWDFLPEPMRSLAPYDRILTGYACCKKCTGDQEIVESIESIESGSEDKKGVYNIGYEHYANIV